MNIQRMLPATLRLLNRLDTILARLETERLGPQSRTDLLILAASICGAVNVVTGHIDENLDLQLLTSGDYTTLADIVRRMVSKLYDTEGSYW